MTRTEKVEVAFAKYQAADRTARDAANAIATCSAATWDMNEKTMQAAFRERARAQTEYIAAAAYSQDD